MNTTTLTGKLRITAIMILLVVMGSTNLRAQDVEVTTTHPAKHRGYEKFGNTLNAGLGIGYFGYFYRSTPFLTVNYEFDVARNFTIAPFLGYASYRSDAYYWSGDYYYYRATIMPIGAKGTYYFDKLLDLNRNWDIYAAASLGFDIYTEKWDNGYHGDKGLARDVSPLFADLHIGAEYHVSNRVGIYLDVSTGVSTLGIGVHPRR